MQGVTNNVTLTLVLCRGCFDHMSTPQLAKQY